MCEFLTHLFINAVKKRGGSCPHCCAVKFTFRKTTWQTSTTFRSNRISQSFWNEQHVILFHVCTTVWTVGDPSCMIVISTQTSIIHTSTTRYWTNQWLNPPCPCVRNLLFLHVFITPVSPVFLLYSAFSVRSFCLSPLLYHTGSCGLASLARLRIHQAQVQSDFKHLTFGCLVVLLHLFAHSKQN